MGILHRDLKPANILVTPKGAAKLLDFELAKLTSDAGADVTITTVGTVQGTPAYMSPEQAEGKDLDQRSDVFRFGAVLYEVLSGTPAFGGNSTAQVLSAVLRDDPAPLPAPTELKRIRRQVPGEASRQSLSECGCAQSRSRADLRQAHGRVY